MCKKARFFSVALQSLSQRLLEVGGRETAKINTAERVRSIAQAFGLSFHIMNHGIPRQIFITFSPLCISSPPLNNYAGGLYRSADCGATELQTIHQSAERHVDLWVTNYNCICEH